MTNDPTTIPQPEPPASSDILDDITSRLGNVMTLLRNQRDMLRQRGVNLPSGALDSVRMLKKQTDILSKSASIGADELRSLRALADTTALVNSAQQTDEVLNEVIDTVIALTGAERGYIVLKNPDTGELEFKVARGIEQEKLTGDGRIISRTIVNRVADTGEPLLTDNASADESYQGTESIVGFNLRSILAVPLRVRDDVIGVVYCDNRMMSALFRQHDLDSLNAFANQAAVAIENARLFESSRHRLNEVTDVRDRMDNLFTSVASGILTIDSQDNILISNTAAQKAIGQRELEGKVLSEVLPDMPEELNRAIEQIRAGEQQHSIEVSPTIDGTERFWQVIISPFYGDDASRGVVMVLEDMTEQKKSESQILEARRYLPFALVDSVRGVDLENIEIEERQITAMFADVRGFTSFSERLEPEELMTVINKYLSLASDAINLFEGIVDKYLGDAVTGLFNTQLNPQTDHATRAVQAAMQLVYDLHAQHEILPEDQRLFYGIGIHSGDAVLGSIGGQGRKEFSALGEATDICKYLQEQAGEGEIIISEATRQLVEEQFEVEPLTTMARPKAGYEHIQCYRVTGRKAGKSLFVDAELLSLLEED